MLKTKKGESIKGKIIDLQFQVTAGSSEKSKQTLGGKVVTISGPDGYIYDADGISGEKIDFLLELRAIWKQQSRRLC